jgi:hypothetical protein
VSMLSVQERRSAGLEDVGCGMWDVGRDGVVSWEVCTVWY